MMLITSSTVIRGEHVSHAVRYAVEDVTRDLGKVLASRSARSDGEERTDGDASGVDIVLVEGPHDPEAYEVTTDAAANGGRGSIEVRAGDDFGFIYGLYAISRELLGVKDLWFWNDQRFEPVPAIEVPADLRLTSKPTAVRYKGFFINDEVLLEDWQVDNDKDKPWRLAFETIYRLGGNLVIPGSGQRGEPHLALARDMGFYINQHHACPLGARMFASAYPGVKPQWPEQQERFEALWNEAIEAQKGQRTVWTLGFRGQGDQPFWAADPRYDTDEKRGELLGRIIRRQYELVQQADPGAPCVVYLYGEAMDLYRKNVLDVPDEVTKIWADNGYGRMVSRRQDNWNPRVPAMPSGDGSNGIYFHASFYDLQAANHITHLCNDPRLIADELARVLANGGDDVWIVNASNIKPHVYLLDLMAAIWRDGPVDAAKHCRRYCAEYYGEDQADAVFNLYEEYWKIAAQYGPNWDDHAGEQFYNYVPRMLINQFLCDRDAPCDGLRWMCDAGSLKEQIEYVLGVADAAARRYKDFSDHVELSAISADLRGDDAAAELIRDSIGVAAGIYEHSSAGAALVCRSLLEAYGKRYRHAFRDAGLAREEFHAGDLAMRSREHDHWAGYWRNDCLTDVKQSAWVCAQLMGYLRCVGDGPHYCQWKRDYTYPESERDVWVIMNMENHETDDEIFAAMKANWREELA